MSLICKLQMLMEKFKIYLLGQYRCCKNVEDIVKSNLDRNEIERK